MTMDLAGTFIERSRYYLRTEYRTKLRAAVEAMPADALWWRGNGDKKGRSPGRARNKL